VNYNSHFAHLHATKDEDKQGREEEEGKGYLYKGVLLSLLGGLVWWCGCRRG